MNYSLTKEEWECVRVCVSNAPIPYDINCDKDIGCTFDYIKSIKWYFEIEE